MLATQQLGTIDGIKNKQKKKLMITCLQSTVGCELALVWYRKTGWGDLTLGVTWTKLKKLHSSLKFINSSNIW